VRTAAPGQPTPLTTSLGGNVAEHACNEASVSAHPATKRSPSAARLARVALSRLATAIALSACTPVGIVGVYTDGGARCDPLTAGCGASRACSLRRDPTMDACRDVDGVASGAPCATPDACASGAQCVSIDARGASLEPAAITSGSCARICARDAPECPSGERCVGILAVSGGVRVDYGVCAP
jgi:hypothetical protein